MRRSILAAVTVCLLALAGCGGTSKQAGPKQTVKTVTRGTITCNTGHYTMQCGLTNVVSPPLAHLIGPRSLAPSLYGVDWAWGGPRSCAAMRSLGAQFGASYLSFDSGKNWTRSLVNELHSCHIGTVSVWETTQYRSLQGFAAGQSDAINARAQAAGIGNADGAITFAIDFDASGPDVVSYFRGAQSVLGSRVNAYGGYRPLAYLHAHGAVGNLNWQTYAWSGGAWLPASIAPLEQYLNGNAFDNDRAIATNYGQFPAPLSGPSQATIRGWRKNREAAFGVYRGHGCKNPQTGNQAPASFGTPNACRDQGAAVISWQGKLWTVFKRWACFGPGAKTTSEVCWVVRPEVSFWSSARRATFKAYAAHKCRWVIYRAHPGRRSVCVTLSNRWRYFNAKASQTVKAFS